MEPQILNVSFSFIIPLNRNYKKGKSMIKYKLTKQGVQNKETGVFIPECKGNRDWRKYQAWLSEGNKPLPMDEPQAVDENEAKIQAKMREMAITDLAGELPDGYK